MNGPLTVDGINEVYTSLGGNSIVTLPITIAEIS